MNKGGVLVGIRPSGRLHLGHWFSVIKPAMDGADVLVADYHAPEADSEEVDTLMRDIWRFTHLVPTIKLQSVLFKPSFYFKLLFIARDGELKRMTQYKSSDNPTAHLYAYPVLMAHDVADYDLVIVGEDQQQHMEYSRTLLDRYNRTFNKNVGLPEWQLTGGRVMSLSDSSKKMSKTDPKGCLFLDDEPEIVKAKIMKAVTDPAGRKNLEVLYKEFVKPEEKDMPDDYSNEVLKDFLGIKIIERLK